MNPQGRFDHRVGIASIAVFAAATALRMPSCYESFWLDELHSAWTVWDGLSEVASRADRGHQSPVYYFGLWLWKQLAGGSELGLRMSSVLATSVACAVLSVGVANWTRNLAAGIAAGMILAIESNAIFFGTELRPYASVILFASIAQVCFLRLVDSTSRIANRGLWSLLIAAILIAALLQPTSLGILALFPVALLTRWAIVNPRHLVRFTLLDAWWMLTGAAVLFVLWKITLGESWQERSQWALFGQATDWRQLLTIWTWRWLLILPLALAIVSALGTRGSGGQVPNGELFVTVSVLSIIAVSGTFLYWFVSWVGWAPIWHRRYFVSVLPIFATIVGLAVEAVASCGRHWSRGERTRIVLGTVTALLLVLGLGWHQRTWQALRTYPVALAFRGEDWRSAVAWVNRNAGDADRIYLDPGLIESRVLFWSNRGREPRRMSEAQAEYLRFPIRGPYYIERAVTLCDLAIQSQLAPIDPRPNEPACILARRPARFVPAPPNSINQRVIPFGGVSVVLRSSTPERSR
jgi:hypothetical protein